MHALLESYCYLVDFLAEVLGKDAEIVLHDVEDIDHSVIAIKNGHISGRSIGSPATNMVLRIMKEGNNHDIDYLANYKGVSADGRTLRSSTFFIRDKNRKLIGLLCVNIDNTKIEQLQGLLESIPSIISVSKDNAAVEHFSSTVEQLVLDSIETAIKESGIPPHRMSQAEKIALVKSLNEEGVFLLKGSVSRVAKRLKVSEATVYRYINGIKEGD